MQSKSLICEKVKTKICQLSKKCIDHFQLAKCKYICSIACATLQMAKSEKKYLRCVSSHVIVNKYKYIDIIKIISGFI